jgi:hypothetical protein
MGETSMPPIEEYLEHGQDARATVFPDYFAIGADRS